MKINSGKIMAVCISLAASMAFLAVSHAFASFDGFPAGPDGSRADGRVSEISSVDAAAYCNHGNGYNETGDRTAAIKDFTAAITLDPYFAQAYYGRGAAYLATGDNVRAVVDLSTAIALKPGFARAYYERGRAYSAAGNRSQAARDFRKAAELEGFASNRP